GNDKLQGGDGDDKYIFNLGDGKDIITERELSEPYLIRQDSFDTVKFTKGVNKDDILLSRNGDDLIIKNKTNGDEITVKNHFFLSNRYYKINSIEFDDGTIWDEKYIDHNAVYYGSDANDELSGYMGNDDIIKAGSGNDTIYGFDGDDEIYGEDGDDYLSGGNGIEKNTGNDKLYGGAGNDQLRGEDGNDYLNGGSGDDRYYYSYGDGFDTIENEGGGSDSLIFFDITRDRLSFSKEENDLIINIDNDANQGVRVKNYFLNDEYALDMIQPSDGYAYTKNDIDNIVNAFDKPTLTEDKNANIIDTKNDEILQGSDKNNTYYYHGGKDLIVDSGGIDTLKFMINGYRLNFSSNGTDLSLSLGNIQDENNNDIVTIKDFFTNKNSIIETIQLKNGYTITSEQIYQSFGKEYPKDDSSNITEPETPEIPQPNENNLVGGDEDNKYIFSGGQKTVIDSGGNDTIKFTQDGNGLNFSTNGTDLTLNVYNHENDTITVKNFFTNPSNIIENFELKNGYTITSEQIYQSFGKEYPKDDSSNITEPETPEIPQPNENNLVGGDEDNKYIFSGGQKTVIDSGGNDTIKFTQDGNGLNFSTNGTDLTLNVYNHENDTITVKNFFTNPSNIIENFELKNGYTITSEQIYQSFGKEYPSNNLEAFGLSNTTINKIVENLNSYSDDLGANLNYVSNAKNNFDIMQIYSN
ncbi:calcium-binding protein, partial [Campylobacter ureolyticus]